MTSRLIRNAFGLVVLLLLACGITGLYQQKEAIKEQSRPHWVIFEGK